MTTCTLSTPALTTAKTLRRRESLNLPIVSALCYRRYTFEVTDEMLPHFAEHIQKSLGSKLGMPKYTYKTLEDFVPR